VQEATFNIDAVSNIMCCQHLLTAHRREDSAIAHSMAMHGRSEPRSAKRALTSARSHGKVVRMIRYASAVT